MALQQEYDPWETQDKDDLAEAYYNHHLRVNNRSLHDENMKLKRLLRENGISWSPTSAAHLSQNRQQPARVTRRSVGATPGNQCLPYLPVEVLLRILNYALVSKDPIIDPLCKLTSENITAKEKNRGNQIAIHVLTTCRTMHAEGTRILWGQNNFLFTHPEALRNFAEVDFAFRKNVKHIQLRIIAQFYDDKKRPHVLLRSYHRSLKKNMALPVKQRPIEHNYARGGFRCYSWSQITDFLQAMRPPWDPKHDKKQARPNLLPGLESMRIDLVNFGDDQLPIFGNELHNMASHELGCSLNELMVTGLPVDDPGLKATTELAGLLRDEGMLLTSVAAYIQTKRGLSPLEGSPCSARIIRSWKGVPDVDSPMADTDMNDDYNPVSQHHHPHGPGLAAAPRETGHPKSPASRKNRSIWKRVPVSRDSERREWIEFCRNSGFPVDALLSMGDDMDDDELGRCPCCGKL